MWKSRLHQLPRDAVRDNFRLWQNTNFSMLDNEMSGAHWNNIGSFRFLSFKNPFWKLPRDAMRRWLPSAWQFNRHFFYSNMDPIKKALSFLSFYRVIGGYIFIFAILNAGIRFAFGRYMPWKPWSEGNACDFGTEACTFESGRLLIIFVLLMRPPDVERKIAILFYFDYY